VFKIAGSMCARLLLPSCSSQLTLAHPVRDTLQAGAAGADGLPEVEVLLKGLMSQPGVEGFMVFNDSGALSRQMALLGAQHAGSCDHDVRQRFCDVVGLLLLQASR